LLLLPLLQVGIYLLLRTIYFWVGLVVLAYAAMWAAALLQRGKAGKPQGARANGGSGKRE
jgi:hypothetical protein